MSEALMKYKLGWKPDLPDARDKKFSIRHFGEMPTKVDLRPLMPPIYDQGSLGSCTANAIAALGEFIMAKSGLKPFTPSRLFIYYNERMLENTIKEDSGASLRSGMKVMASCGLPHEDLWWYNPKKFTVKPNQKVYADGLRHVVTNFQRVPQTLTQMKGCLASGLPFVFGFSVYENFERNMKDNILPLPGPREKVLGGHAVLCHSFDDETQLFGVRNSWSAKWGDAGNFYIPFQYMINNDYADDFWTSDFSFT